MTWESSIDKRKLPCVKQLASGKLLHRAGSLAGGSEMTSKGGLGGEWEAPEGGDICLHTADSFCCTAETSTTLSSNSTPI